jgi:hypothetical protein
LIPDDISVEFVELSSLRVYGPWSILDRRNVGKGLEKVPISDSRDRSAVS